MSENPWGWLEPFEKFGRIGDSKDNFITISYSDSKVKYPKFTHASHGMIYAKDDRLLWDLYRTRASILVSAVERHRIKQIHDL